MMEQCEVYHQRTLKECDELLGTKVNNLGLNEAVYDRNVVLRDAYTQEVVAVLLKKAIPRQILVSAFRVLDMLNLVSGNRGNATMLATERENVWAVVEPQDKKAYYDKLGAGANIIELPENNQGIAYVRQWIFDFASRQSEPWYWMLDDDISAFSIADPATRRNNKVQMEVALFAAQALIETRNVAQAALEYQQFSWSAPKDVRMNGYCDVAVAINPRRACIARYDPEVAGKEDRDFTMQLIAAGAGTMRCCHVGFAAPKNGSNPGGLSEWYADRERERAVTMKLVAKWGPGVCALKVKKDGRPDCAISWKALTGAGSQASASAR